MEQSKNHSLTVEYGQGLVATGVVDVVAFSEREIRLALSVSRLLIVGEKLKITGFNKSNGELRVNGVVGSIKYLQAPLSPVKRFFK